MSNHTIGHQIGRVSPYILGQIMSNSRVPNNCPFPIMKFGNFFQLPIVSSTHAIKYRESEISSLLGATNRKHIQKRKEQCKKSQLHANRCVCLKHSLHQSVFCILNDTICPPSPIVFQPPTFKFTRIFHPMIISIPKYLEL